MGAYWYSYAMSPEEAELEEDVFLKVIKGKQFEMPVYFDLEEKKQFDLGKEKVSAIMRAFLERVESAGYFTGLYGSASPLFTHTADDIKSHYTIWLAHWVDRTNYSGAYAVWQYSEKGKVDGISGNVDLDICYKDFPTIIKGKGLNGWGKAANPTPVPDPRADRRQQDRYCNRADRQRDLQGYDCKGVIIFSRAEDVLCPFFSYVSASQEVCYDRFTERKNHRTAEKRRVYFFNCRKDESVCQFGEIVLQKKRCFTYERRL